MNARHPLPVSGVQGDGRRALHPQTLPHLSRPRSARWSSRVSLHSFFRVPLVPPGGKCTPLGPCRRPMPRVLGGPGGVGVFLWARYLCTVRAYCTKIQATWGIMQPQIMTLIPTHWARVTPFVVPATRNNRGCIRAMQTQHAHHTSYRLFHIRGVAFMYMASV